MNISGEEAKLYDAIRLDSFARINQGMLIEADDATGMVAWIDKTGERKEARLGDHAIRLVRR